MALLDDTNVMTTPKYIPQPGFLDTQTTVDYDSYNFKYGLGYWRGTLDKKLAEPIYFFQDPLLPSVDIILDTIKSPLFVTDQGSIFYKNSLSKFLNDYSNIYAINTRIKYHSEFLKTLSVLFNNEFKSINKNKAYYINSISGLDKLTARIVEFEKDILTFNINEDVSMISAYLSLLYNNLSYSYRDQRYMIPANLLRFNMYIKVSDVRNMYFYLPNGETGSTISKDKSYLIYYLRDCTFNFKKSKNFDDTITVGGYDVGAQTKPSSLSFDITYKSVEIESEYPLIKDSMDANESSALKINNKDFEVLGYEYGINEVFGGNDKTIETFLGELTYSKEQLNTISDNNGPLKANKNNSLDPNIIKYESDVIVSQGTEPTWKTSSESDTTYETQNNYRDDRLNQKSLIEGPGITSSDLENKRNYSLADFHSYDPSVFLSDWNFGFGFTGPEIQSTRNILLNSLNLEGFLFTLPLNILTKFFGDLHGLSSNNTLYVYDPQDLGYYGPRGENIQGSPVIQGLNDDYLYNNKISNEKEIENKNVNEIPSSQTIPDDWRVDTTVKDQKILSGEINTDFKDKEPLDARIDNTYKEKDPISGGMIYTIKPHQTISGNINTEIKPLQTINGKINTEIKPQQTISGQINTSVKPHLLLSGYINTDIKPIKPIYGNIDTTIKPRETEMSYIEFSIKPRVEFNTRIDTSFVKNVNQMGYVYRNSYEERVVDLGLLHGKIDHENLVSLIYLYSKINKFNDLANYKVYNNFVSEIKPLNNLYVEQGLRSISPFNIIYEYDNKFNLSKTIEELLIYNNNVNKINNINVINFFGTPKIKSDFNEIKLYDYKNATKSLSDIYLYDNSNKTKEKFEGIILYPYNDSKKILSETYLHLEPEIEKEIEKIQIYKSSEKIKTFSEVYIDTSIEERNYLLKNLGKVYEQLEIDKDNPDLGFVYVNPNNIYVYNPVSPTKGEKNYYRKNVTIAKMENDVENNKFELNKNVTIENKLKFKYNDDTDLGKLYAPTIYNKTLSPYYIYKKKMEIEKDIDLGNIYENVEKIYKYNPEKPTKGEINYLRGNRVEEERKYDADYYANKSEFKNEIRIKENVIDKK